MDVRFNGTRLVINGFVYKRINSSQNRTYWRCTRHSISCERSYFSCDARAITSKTLFSDTLSSDSVTVYKGPNESPHNHIPTLEEIVCVQNTASWKPRNRKRIHTSQDKKKAEDFMTNPDVYHKFLEKFAENPVFDREHVMEALKSVYKTEKSRIYAYAAILENRERIFQDFETFKTSPSITLYTLEECHSTTDVHGNGYYGPETPTSKTTPEVIDGHLEKMEELRRRASQLQDMLTPDQGPEVVQTNTSETDDDDLNEFANIPPVPAALPIRDFFTPGSPSAIVKGPTNNEIEVKKEIELIDLTDNVDVKRECPKQSVLNSKQILQSHGKFISGMKIYTGKSLGGDDDA
ncbi:hypothetical protein QAD02_006710 [Eretmocerus hayati]|uniref:Uncharacterized protein n=1 Tax=Eretmocerus hayati TaxID=131215 RepID=A0ACC2N1P1_9HYME|nr:hypothetical protein QAD02_006710 [Eretmocerus hayati]